MVELSQSQAAKEVMRYIGTAAYYHCAAYDTPLVISDNDGDDPFHHFELFSRKILWINPVIEMGSNGQTLAPRVVIPCKSAEDFDGVLVMNRLASLLCYTTQGTAMSVLTHAGTGFPAAVIAQPQQMTSGLLYSHRGIDLAIRRENPREFSDKKWITLAHYRQGIIARTPYYEFLSLWKVLELLFDDANAIKAHIRVYFNNYPDSAAQLHQGGSSSPYVKLYRTRQRCAHFALQQRKGDEIQDPDDPDIYIAAQEDAEVLRSLIEEAIAGGRW